MADHDPKSRDSADTLANPLELDKETLRDLDLDPKHADAVKGGAAASRDCISERCLTGITAVTATAAR